MNILLTSVGRRSYLVKYFQEALSDKGKIHVSNSSAITPAFKISNYSVVTPLIYDKEYIPFLLNYCKNNDIQAIISLFDIDLPILSNNKKLFKENNIQVIVSDPDVIDICNDKIKTAKFLKENNINTPKTYKSVESVELALNNEEIQFPLILKPRWGMGSIGVLEANNFEEFYVLYRKTLNTINKSYLKYESKPKLDESIIIQEKLQGQEYGLDVINDLHGNYQTTIVKKKYAMRSGETDAAITVNNPELKKLGKKISNLLNHIGNLDVDVFLDDDKAYVLEINARFGGGYPFSHMAGVNLPLAIVKWLSNEKISDETLTEKYNVLAHKDINMTILGDV